MITWIFYSSPLKVWSGDGSGGGGKLGRGTAGGDGATLLACTRTKFNDVIGGLDGSSISTDFSVIQNKAVARTSAFFMPIR